MPTPPVPADPDGSPREAGVGLDLRFVTRMSRPLGDAIAAAARRDGVTKGAWVRRLLLDRLDLRSDPDTRSGRPSYLPAEEIAELSAAVRELASVNFAIAAGDIVAAKAGLDRARGHLIPILMRQSRR